ncbi:MAG: hypothetical protein AAFV97_03165 [Bacteroidota bacterium]
MHYLSEFGILVEQVRGSLGKGTVQCNHTALTLGRVTPLDEVCTLEEIGQEQAELQLVLHPYEDAETFALALSIIHMESREKINAPSVVQWVGKNVAVQIPAVLSVGNLFDIALKNVGDAVGSQELTLVVERISGHHALIESVFGGTCGGTIVKVDACRCEVDLAAIAKGEQMHVQTHVNLAGDDSAKFKISLKHKGIILPQITETVECKDKYVYLQALNPLALRPPCTQPGWQNTQIDWQITIENLGEAIGAGEVTLGILNTEGNSVFIRCGHTEGCDNLQYPLPALMTDDQCKITLNLHGCFDRQHNFEIYFERQGVRMLACNSAFHVPPL